MNEKAKSSTPPQASDLPQASDNNKRTMLPLKRNNACADLVKYLQNQNQNKKMDNKNPGNTDTPQTSSRSSIRPGPGS